MNNRNGIPSESGAIKAETIAAQAEFFAKSKDAGFSIEVIAAYTGLPTTTLKQWANGTVMPIHAVNSITRFCPGFPNEIASILTGPGERVINDAAPCETDPHDAALKAWELVGEMLRAQHPGSPGAERVVHTELPRIRLAAQAAVAGAGKVVAL